MKVPKPQSPTADQNEKRASRPASAAPRKLFEVQAKPLETGVTPISQVRPPRRKGKFWAAIMLALGILPATAQQTNAPAPDSLPAPSTNALATNNPAVANPPSGPSAKATLETRAARRDAREDRSRAGTSASTNSATRPGGRQDFAAFRIISERNIFDPNRNPRRTQSNNAARPKPKVVDSLGLVGVMSYEKGTFAFFDGSKSEFRKAVKPSQTIAGLKLEAVDDNQVRLAKNGKTFELKVGMQLKREDEGEWQAGGSADTYAPSPGASSTTGQAASSSGGDAQQATSAPAQSSPGADNEVLKRLMQRREQE